MKGVLPILVLIASILAGLAFWKRERPCNVVVITLDTLRADHVSCFTGAKTTPGARTPNLDRLATRGVLFTRLYSHVPITLPSHASFFGSRLPHETTARSNAGHYSARGFNLPSFFKKKGYETAAFVSLGTVQGGTGMATGFDSFSDQFPGEPAERYYLQADEVSRRVLDWLRQPRRKPFFLWAHYSDPHEPYYAADRGADLLVQLQDQVLGEYRSGRREALTATFDVPAGRSYLYFIPRLDSLARWWPGTGHQPQVYVDDIEITSTPAVQVKFREGWDKDIERPTGTRRLIKLDQPFALILLINEKDKPARATLRFRPGLRQPIPLVKDQYAREVEFADRQIGLVLDELEATGMSEQTVVLFFSDHGEELEEHGHTGHVQNLYEPAVAVPAILAGPGAGRRDAASARNDVPAGLMDLAPTLIARAGLEIPEGIGGRDLLAGNTPPRPVFMETFRPEADNDKFGVIEPPLKVIFTPELRSFELYDIEADPAETRNLFDERRCDPKVRAMVESVYGLARQAAGAAGAAQTERDRATLEMLDSLDYVQAHSRAASRDIGPDPYHERPCPQPGPTTTR